MRYFIGFLVTIGLIVLLIVLLITHHSGPTPATKAPLISFSNSDTVVKTTIDGPINDPADHRQVQITVGRNNTTFQLLQGYDGNPLNTQTYPMTENAYDSFLHALQHAGYQLGNDTSTKTESGYCPEGSRYVFEIIQNGKDLERYWYTSCGGGRIPSTFKGNTNLILQLFQAQVPGYNQLVENTNLQSL